MSSGVGWWAPHRQGRRPACMWPRAAPPLHPAHPRRKCADLLHIKPASLDTTARVPLDKRGANGPFCACADTKLAAVVSGSRRTPPSGRSGPLAVASGGPFAVTALGFGYWAGHLSCDHQAVACLCMFGLVLRRHRPSLLGYLSTHLAARLPAKQESFEHGTSLGRADYNHGAPCPIPSTREAKACSCWPPPVWAPSCRRQSPRGRRAQTAADDFRKKLNGTPKGDSKTGQGRGTYRPSMRGQTRGNQ